jgi:hypothetical protein
VVFADVKTTDDVVTMFTGAAALGELASSRIRTAAASPTVHRIQITASCFLPSGANAALIQPIC